MEYEILIFLFHFLYHLLSHFLFHFLYRVTIVWRPRVCRHGLEEMGTGPGRWGQALAGEGGDRPRERGGKDFRRWFSFGGAEGNETV